MNRLLAAFCIVAGLCASVAHADANSAFAAYFDHRERLHYEVATRATSVARADTMVNGIYRLEDRASGRFIALITERGDLKGDSEGWSRVGPEGPIPTTERSWKSQQLRAEVMLVKALGTLVDRAPLWPRRGASVDSALGCLNCFVPVRQERRGD
ncbi:MAG: hypothetical protein U5M53_13230 [Rhodoferax sp.]|nr:hypothetical protein [Rhodoferax sp.]